MSPPVSASPLLTASPASQMLVLLGVGPHPKATYTYVHSAGWVSLQFTKWFGLCPCSRQQDPWGPTTTLSPIP